MIKFYILILSLALLTSCFGGSKGLLSSYTINSRQSYISNDLLDNYPTSELYFKLNSPAKCITVNVTAKYESDYLNEAASPKIFFVVQRELDIQHFSQTNKSIFVELGKNFNSNWDHSSSVKICTISSDPIQKIAPDILYRIKFTDFDKRDVQVTVTIDSRATFFNSYPQAN